MSDMGRAQHAKLDQRGHACGHRKNSVLFPTHIHTHVGVPVVYLLHLLRAVVPATDNNARGTDLLLVLLCPSSALYFLLREQADRGGTTPPTKNG